MRAQFLVAGLFLALAVSVAAGPACYVAGDCNNHGECVNGVCHCDPGFSGLANCTNHGNCVDLACQCDDGWDGNRCQTSVVGPCKLKCDHGGTPSADCKTCENCMGAWSGPTCSTWDEAVPLSTLKSKMNTIKTQQEAYLSSLTPMKPLPSKIGWGLDITTLEFASYPVVELTYSDGSKTWNGFREPVEATFMNYQIPEPEMSVYVFPTIAEYLSTKSSMVSKQDGRAGLFASDDISLFNTMFNDGQDYALSLAQQSTAVYKQTLPFDPVTKKRQYKLARFAAMAYESLPPAYDSSTNQEMYKEFIAHWGTSYTTEVVSGGLLEQESRWKTYLTAQGAYGSFGPGGNAFNLASLQTEAGRDFTQTTGQGGISGAVDAAYSAHRITKTPTCYGGDPALCVSGDYGKWEQSLKTAAEPVTFVMADISELIDDESKRTGLQNALNDYINEQQGRWTGKDLCPPNCSSRGSCAKGGSKCSCENYSVGRMCSACLPGWGGSTCGSPLCPGCAHGTCTSPGSCRCSGHFTGTLCNKCASGWSGSSCTTPVCSPACRNGGRCVAPDSCKCSGHYAGSDCTACASGWSGSGCNTGKSCCHCHGSGKICTDHSFSGCAFYETCNSCGGTGQIASNLPCCFMCGGSGHICGRNDEECNFPETCPGCQGKGYDPVGASRCPTCHGSGQICDYSTDFDCSFPETCGTCGGKGWVK